VDLRPRVGRTRTFDWARDEPSRCRRGAVEEPRPRVDPPHGSHEVRSYGGGGRRGRRRFLARVHSARQLGIIGGPAAYCRALHTAGARLLGAGARALRRRPPHLADCATRLRPERGRGSRRGSRSARSAMSLGTGPRPPPAPTPALRRPMGLRARARACESRASRPGHAPAIPSLFQR
jgi:hypothetical protein